MPKSAKRKIKVSFDVSLADSELITKISRRFHEKAPDAEATLLDTQMDLTATHANGNPLRLADLLAADTFNLFHDIYGIRNCLDRSTGRLAERFSPRFSA